MGFSVPNYQQYYDDAWNKLSEYYSKILADEGGDIDRAKQRLLQDYQRGVRINTEDYDRNIAFGRESYNASVKEQGMDSESEQRKLESDMVRRGIAQGGVAEQEQGRLKSRQDLRREAIDRALKKSEEDLRFGKERSLEEETIKQKRGTEDVNTEWSKFQTEKQQERQEKSLNLAESSYQREFQKRSTEEGFRLQQESLNKMG